MSPKNLVTYLDESKQAGLCPLLRIKGKGIATDPLKLILVLRHSDIANEANSFEAYNQTVGLLECLDEAISSINLDQSLLSTDKVICELKRVLQDGDTKALRTGSYYSAAIAILVGGRLIMSIIGHSKAWLWNKGTLTVLLEPTVLPVPGQKIENALLTAALGNGFTTDKIRSGEFELKDGELAIIGMKTELKHLLSPGTLPNDKMFISPEELLQEIKNQSEVKPPLIVIIE